MIASIHTYDLLSWVYYAQKSTLPKWESALLAICDVRVLDECQSFAEGFADGGEGVKPYAVAACLNAGNMRPLHLHAVGEVLLGHAFLLSQLGDVLPYALPLLFVLYHSSLFVKTGIYQRRTAE